MKKTLITILVTVLVCGSVFGTTLALLTAKTESIQNAFTVGKIDITLTESKDLDLKMVPGKELNKDPKVTVAANSEACYLFVKITKGGDFDNFMTYDIADGWTLLETDVYYRKVSLNATDDQEFPVLKDNKVFVKDTLTKNDLNGAAPTLAFTAYAVQQLDVENETAAWNQVKNLG